MEHLSGHEIITKLIMYLVIMWSLLLIPLLVMIILVFTGYGDFVTHNELSWRILYYNLLLFPVVIIVSSVSSWILLKKKRYGLALAVILLPLLNVFVELIAVDLVLWFF